jgi:2-iminobutanoate/2-iminopropanoate deaminase
MEFAHSDSAPKAIGPYSQAVVSGGFVFCSGQTPLDPSTMEVVGIEVETQTRRVLQNLELVLAARGLNRAHIVKTTVFLKNMTDFPRMNGVYAEFFGAHRPARSTVEVSRLPKDALVEIECVAELPG